MALTSTIYNATVEISDVDRGVYETVAVRLAMHPSETTEYMATRLLAYCLEYTEGIEMTAGLSDGNEPAIVVRDLTGRITAWIEVGLPDADRLHRARMVLATALELDIMAHTVQVQNLAQQDGASVPELGDHSCS